MVKKDIRRKILSQRASAHARNTSDDDQRLSRAIIDCIDGMPIHPKREQKLVVAAYIPIVSEANILPAVAKIVERGWRVVLPCVDRPHTAMTWREWTPSQELVADPIGLKIRQPSDAAPLVSPCALTHLLVPVVAVDQQGYRIGYGGGYYDRTVEKMTQERQRAQEKHQPWMIGVGYEEQCVFDQMLGEPHDIQLHCMVTHRKTIPFA